MTTAMPEGTEIQTLADRFGKAPPDFVMVLDSWCEVTSDWYDDETEYVFLETGPLEDEPEIDPIYSRRLIATPINAEGYRDPQNQLVFAY